MTTYGFTLLLSRDGIHPTDWWHDFVEAVYPHAADSSAFMAGGKAYLHFDREADSFRDAVASAIRGVRQADPVVAVCGIETEDGRPLDSLIAGLHAAVSP